MLKWIPFDPNKGYRQKRPPLRKHVLCLCASRQRGTPRYIAVGYRKDAAGCKDSPYFVIPGIGGQVIAWCDCLPPEIEASVDNGIYDVKVVKKPFLRDQIGFKCRKCGTLCGPDTISVPCEFTATGAQAHDWVAFNDTFRKEEK